MDAKPPIRPQLDIGSGPRALPRSGTVLLLVDYINPLQFSGSQDIAPFAIAGAHKTLRLKRLLHAQGVPAIYANDNYGIWRSEFHDILSYCASLPGVPGEMARLLAPGKDDLAILKPRHSGFYATPLELLLTQIQARRLIIVGLATDICVQVSAMDAYLRGYEVWVPPDCTAAESRESWKNSLDYMHRVLKCDTRTVAEWEAEEPPEGGKTA